MRAAGAAAAVTARRANHSSGLCLILAAGQAGAQQPTAPTANAAVKYGFDEVSGLLARAADPVPVDKYNYKPGNTLRAFGELMAHGLKPPSS